MKKFSKVSGIKVNEEPVKSKENLELEAVKASIIKLMDSYLTIRSYGSVSPIMKVPTKISGKELFAEALISFMNDKNLKEQIKVLENLKYKCNDWISIDESIDTVKFQIANIELSDKYRSHINKVEILVEKYSKDECQFDMVIESQLSKINDIRFLSDRVNAIKYMISVDKYKKDKKHLINISEACIGKINKLNKNAG